jgi:hypothetical protein
MVESKIIRDCYNNLLDLVKLETIENTTINEFYNYIKSQEQNFVSGSNINYKNDLKEFLRGANRFSDEFKFSDKYSYEIKIAMSTLYDILNSSVDNVSGYLN